MGKTTNESLIKNEQQEFLEKHVLRLEKISTSTKPLKAVMDLDGLLQHLENDLNLSITNRTDMSSILIEKGYFKFSGYRRIFLTSYSEDKWSGCYEDGVTDKDLMNLMQLDIELSKLFFDFIAIIEMKMKARAAYFISKKYGCDAYLKKEIFSTEKKWKEFMIDHYFSTIDKEKRNNDPIVMHHISNYDAKLPIWALFDKLSFGAFLSFLQILKYEVKVDTFEDIFCSYKTYYNLADYGYVKSYTDYLTIIKFMRNRVCHHDRILDYKHRFTPADNKYRNIFMQQFENKHENEMYLSDIGKLMGCFLNKEEYKKFRQRYKELVNRCKNDMPLAYRTRLLKLLGFETL